MHRALTSSDVKSGLGDKKSFSYFHKCMVMIYQSKRTQVYRRISKRIPSCWLGPQTCELGRLKSDVCLQKILRINELGRQSTPMLISLADIMLMKIGHYSNVFVGALLASVFEATFERKFWILLVRDLGEGRL